MLGSGNDDIYEALITVIKQSSMFPVGGSAVSNNSALNLANNSATNTTFATDVTYTSSLVAVEIRQSGAQVNVPSTVTPYTLIIPLVPGMAAPENATCRFWDHSTDTWSTAGMRLVGVLRDGQNNSNGSVVCETNHLTPFNAK